MKSLDINKIREEVNKGNVKEIKHPKLPLLLFNYTQHLQYSGEWNEINIKCRGLILEDSTYNIIAKPFDKFFNYTEVRHKIPNEKFQIYEKYDGSLGILFNYDNQWFITTKGSFESEQAKLGQKLLEKYDLSFLNKDITYLIEIISPKNKIVVQYTKDDLILIGGFNKNTFEEVILDELISPFTKSKLYDISNNIEDLYQYQKSNFEGFVIRFENGFRVKVKLEEYLKLHKLLTDRNPNKTIYEFLSEDKDINPYIESFPDEFLPEVKNTINIFLTEHNKIYNEVIDVFNNIKLLENRKEQAIQIKDYKYKSLIFSLLDNKNIKQSIWKFIDYNSI